MVDGGAALVQLRHKGEWTANLLQVAENLRVVCPSLIVNDRADVARLLDCGVHVGQSDLPPAAARRILPSATIGLSTHNAAQLAEATAEPIDYVALGPIFSTSSKANPDPVVGLPRLREWRSLTVRPLVAIGGIVRENALDVLDAGADSVAVIGDLYPDPPVPQAIRRRVEEWMRLLA